MDWTAQAIRWKKICGEYESRGAGWKAFLCERQIYTSSFDYWRARQRKTARERAGVGRVVTSARMMSIRTSSDLSAKSWTMFSTRINPVGSSRGIRHPQGVVTCRGIGVSNYSGWLPLGNRFSQRRPVDLRAFGMGPISLTVLS
jgi:hypothetical protein